MPISDSIFQCDDRTTVGHFGKNSRLCQILNGRFQVISFQKILFVFLTVLIISWRGLIWVSAEPLPCTPRLTVTQIVYMQSSTNTQVGFNFPPWSLIFGWFWLSSQPDLCQPSDLLYPDKPADGLEGRLRMARWRFSKLKGFVFMNSDQFLSSMQPSGSSLRQPIPSPVWLLLHQRCKKVFKFESRTCSGCGIQLNRNILKS